MINLGNGKYRSLEEINNGLHLTELVKERMKYLETIYAEILYVSDEYKILQSLLKDSENA